MKRPTSKDRGDLLEHLVAMLHQFPGVNVQKGARLPAIGSPSKRERDIDVLLLQHVAGYPIKIAIECKNEKKRVGTLRIDEFIGRLEDVGISVQQGIFVSPVGYTKPGLERAQKRGLKTLRLDGLTADRLGVAVNESLQTLIFLIATITTLNRFENPKGLPTSPLPEGLPSEFGNDISALYQFVWYKWSTGTIPESLGSHHLFIRLPPEFHFKSNEPPFRNGLVVVTVAVTAHVARLPGTAQCLTLNDASTNIPEKIYLSASFESPKGALELETIETAERLRRYSGSFREGPQISQLIRVPRIVTNMMFWPPSTVALERIRHLQEQGEAITFENVEGTNLRGAWDGFLR